MSNTASSAKTKTKRRHAWWRHLRGGLGFAITLTCVLANPAIATGDESQSQPVGNNQTVLDPAKQAIDQTATQQLATQTAGSSSGDLTAQSANGPRGEPPGSPAEGLSTPPAAEFATPPAADPLDVSTDPLDVSADPLDVSTDPLDGSGTESLGTASYSLNARPGMSPSAVKTANQAAVTAAYNALRGFESVPHNWNGSASRCQAGADSQANRDATIAAINTYRAMAGLDPLREDKALSSRAAYAALIMEANNRVTHYPAKNSACWTQTGYTESGRSNLTLGAHGAAAVSALMTDTGPTNEATVGHRSWLLKPRLGSVGTASSARTNAISVQGGATNQKAANPAAIPWPSAGYFPWQWVRPYMSWSVSSAGADFSAARVTVTKNGQPISASRYPSGPTKGVETLVWSMSDVTQPAPGVTDSYEVKVTGVRQAAAGSFSYSVKIYWVPEIEINESLNYNILPSGSQLATGRSILSSYIGLKPAQAKATRQWLADGVPIAGATGVTLLLTDRLQCLPIGIRYSATYPGAATVSRTWNSIASWEGCPAPTGLRLPSAGTIKAPFASLSLLPDVNGNGLGEIIALDQASKLVLYPLTTTTSLGQPGRLGYGFTGHRLYSPGDWNRDGWPDIMTITPDNLLWLYPGATGGRIGSGRQIGNGWGGYQLVPSGDVTGDGVPDLLAVDSTGYLWIYPNDGRGGFRSRVKAGHGWSGLRLYAAGDADRNGTNDIFMLNPAGDLYFYGGYGNAVFATKRKVGNGWTGFELLSGTDLTGDGMADIVGRSTEGNLYLYRGTGGGAFAKKIQVGRGW